MNCPNEVNFFCGDGLRQSLPHVEGGRVWNNLMDTGWNRMTVREDLISEERLLPAEAITVLCNHVDAILFPLASIKINIEGLHISVKAAVFKDLPVLALQGTDTPLLGQLLQIKPWIVSASDMSHTMVITQP